MNNYSVDIVINNITQFCKLNKISGVQLGKILGLSKSPLTEWKNRASKPTLDHILTIMQYFNLQPDDIFAYDKQFCVNISQQSLSREISHTISDLDNKLHNKIQMISEKRKFEIENYLDYLIFQDLQENSSLSKKHNIVSISSPKTVDESNINDIEAEYTKLPMYGKVAAGEPIDLPDAYSIADVIDVPKTKESTNADFALQVKGDSMEPLVHDGDIVLIKTQSTAYDGQIVVASIDDTATLKKFHEYPDRFELESLNPQYPPIIVEKSEFKRFRIIGIKL